MRHFGTVSMRRIFKFAVVYSLTRSSTWTCKSLLQVSTLSIAVNAFVFQAPQPSAFTSNRLRAVPWSDETMRHKNRFFNCLFMNKSLPDHHRLQSVESFALKHSEQSPISVSSRRSIIFFPQRLMLASAILGLSATMPAPSVAVSVGTATSELINTSDKPVTYWYTGKPPQVVKPGMSIKPLPRDPKAAAGGSRKDPSFLRSIADCKNQCENNYQQVATSDGAFTKSKEECLSECQDVCCKTYEQCTFAIVPRI
jgi:hypothetical protein